MRPAQLGKTAVVRCANLALGFVTGADGAEEHLFAMGGSVEETMESDPFCVRFVAST